MDDAQLAQRFSILEAQIKLLSDRLGVPCPSFPGAVAPSAGPSDATGTGQVPDEVDLARAGKSTQAISRYRQLTGATLLEAKTIVDGL
jgi:ribosomal protein L7/L12